VVILTSASLHRSVWKSHGWNEINEPIYKRTCGYIIKLAAFSEPKGWETQLTKNPLVFVAEM